MAKVSDIFVWFDSVRGRPIPKFITGLRGTGKASALLSLRDCLLETGVPAENVLTIDADDPAVRRHATHEQILDGIFASLPAEGKTYIFIREAASLPGPEVVIGSLAASDRREVFATSSSRRLLDHGLAGYFAGRLSRFEMLPRERREPYTPDSAKARWNEIFLKDVLAPSRILEVSLAGRIAGWLSDNLGDPVSLRSIAAGISPARRFLSPHTIESYLSSLEDAYLVEKTIRWDTAEEAPQNTGYRYFFTDPQLRFAYFGPAPDKESRRMALNRAWLRLRRTADEVFAASGSSDVDFVARIGRVYSRWRVTGEGLLTKVAD